MEPDLFENAIPERELSETLSENFLAFALATIKDRALPDARDGLKPVQRRLLYAMHELRLGPNTPFKKAARIVGDVIGKYHPHGDQAAYDALVRLAQSFAIRYPLVDGQGNFGNIDGDNAAAMRYTEARLTEISALLLEGLDEDAVAFRPTFTEEDNEPVVLPAAFPNLLANGAIGIAVGMATSIPPHNIGELCNALLRLIEAPNIRYGTLLELVPGPDFPTGGVLVEPPESVREAYETGRGAFRLRARWTREKTGHGQYAVVITEIPYQVQKSRLIEKLAELVISRKNPLLADVRDESGEDVRIVLEPRSRAVKPELLMETLFRQTDLETRVQLNLNVLHDGNEPKVLSLRETLQVFLDHRREVLLRRTHHRLERIDRRIEILDGYAIAYLNLDRVIEILRHEDRPKESLIAEFGLTELQADAILDMRLRNLRKLEEFALKEERNSLDTERKTLHALTRSKDRQWKHVADEIRKLRTQARKTEAWKRRTLIEAAPEIEAPTAEAMVEREQVTVVCSKQGWIRALRGHLEEEAELSYKDGDEAAFRFHAETTDRLLLFGSSGRFYTLACNRLPGGRGAGEPVRLTFDLSNDETIIALFPHRPGTRRLLASSDGRGLVVLEDAQLTLPGRKAGKQTLTLRAPARAVTCAEVAGDMVAVASSSERLLVFPLDEIPEQERGRGILLQRIKEGELADATVFELDKGLSWRERGGRTRTERELENWIGKRAGAGRKPPRGFPKPARFT